MSDRPVAWVDMADLQITLPMKEVYKIVCGRWRMVLVSDLNEETALPDRLGTVIDLQKIVSDFFPYQFFDYIYYITNIIFTHILNELIF